MKKVMSIPSRMLRLNNFVNHQLRDNDCLRRKLQLPTIITSSWRKEWLDSSFTDL